ncbi:ESX secretion-associated protein EspG [Nocardia sp. CDC153]|uniref:ESX secretion-associated protein EspG n=1 Tax=Nocardia sp. CDC153 TaxID=3112167 RepID=UPI002DBC8A8A|nr:ESX secretion-associated protein EspG [Nocardia sp. CDC153]MEC3955044.1 ESX secretion-associated protein EspG [Nocardia sp. CDC153]
MLRTWKFTDLEFLALWEGLGEEFLPRPLTFTSRTQWWDDHLANMARARESLRAREDDDYAEVLRALLMPDVRVEVHGWDGRDRLSASASIRLLGVRSGEAGYLLVQHPGETYAHSSGFTLSEFYAEALAERMVAELPDTPVGRDFPGGPGGDLVLAETEDVEDTDYEFGLSPAHETLEGTVVTRAADFLAAPAESMGTIDVVQGRSRFGPRGIARYRLGWRDLENDGRYVVTGEHPPVAAAADRRRMVAVLETHIAEVVQVMADE